MHELNSCSGGCVSRKFRVATALRENVAGAGLQLPHEAIKELNHAALRQSNSRVHY
jgi:hypothetical protein